MDLLHNSYLKSVVMLASGSFIAQLVAFLCSPVITRLYTPEDMGVFTYVLSLVTIFMGVINGRYDISVVTDSSEDNVFPLMKLSFLIGFVVTILATAGLGVVVVGKGISASWIIYIFLVLLSYAIINPLTAYNNRNKEYKTISITYTIRKSVQSIGSIICALFTRTGHGLMLPYAVGQYLGVRQQSKNLRGRWKEIVDVPKEDVMAVAKQHRNQPIFSMPAQLVNSLSYSLITIIITQLYGMAIVGYYSISVKLLGLPLALIGGNISKVFVERASKEYAETGSFSVSYKKTFYLLLAIGVPMVLLLYFFAPWFCELFFGEGWGVSGEYIKLLAPMFGIRFITSALSPSMVIVNKQKFELALQALFLVSNFIGFFLAKRLDLPAETFLTIINWLFFAAYGAYLALSYYFSRKPKFNHA